MCKKLVSSAFFKFIKAYTIGCHLTVHYFEIGWPRPKIEHPISWFQLKYSIIIYCCFIGSSVISSVVWSLNASFGLLLKKITEYYLRLHALDIQFFAVVINHLIIQSLFTWYLHDSILYKATTIYLSGWEGLGFFGKNIFQSHLTEKKLTLHCSCKKNFLLAPARKNRCSKHLVIWDWGAWIWKEKTALSRKCHGRNNIFAFLLTRKKYFVRGRFWKKIWT